MSKKAMKKAAKAERYQAFKLERRAREKQMQKEKRRLKAQKRAAGELDDSAELEEKARKRQKMSGFGGKIVLDLSFDKLMSEKEINSLCSQLAYTYSANRNASYPFTLLCTSLNGRTRDRLEAINDGAYKRWTHTEWWENSYDCLWSSPGVSSSTREASLPQADLDVQKQKIVYLTADSGEEIEELKPGETYIIGALVDRNRYKNLTFDKATKESIRHARLPIGKYISSLPTRKVLTVNQVFEIMLKWVETRDWEEAFNCIIPKRKFLDSRKKGKDKSLSEKEEVVSEGEGGDITSDQAELKIDAEDLEKVVQEDQLLEAQA
ncbi:MAG: guanine-1-methyltransferase-domain-containing protein [Lentinula lateritia]|uniref:tRNA (guanine(9)-N1)-methyltransferase n=1 Tax=Lentinula lateritia TaxID=40482 RepID=A0ABQ8VKU5_9AGAR|nr:MAG: guanine-1-methyltransferase-domain-containing protein [Lentinula lateritia]KAJ4496906.1 guanine-1-methyltransferase-domain-containing protein [Lentinula lateritia]